ncbi:MAG: ion transporter [Gammaproteobacteria bacterium]
MAEPTKEGLTGARLKAADLVEHSLFTQFIITLIIINAITLGLETSQVLMADYGRALVIVDRAILVVFTLELLLKLFAYRLAFFRSGWNNFDFVIVVIAWVPSSGPFSILRALRILRVLRLLSVVPQMRRVVAAIGHSIPGMTSVISVLGLLFYVASVMATKLFGQHADPNMQEWFGSVGASAYTLFQIMTLESWSMGIVRPTMELYPWSWVFFLPFIIITSFAVLNLFIGIIVDSMQRLHENESEVDTTVTISKEEAAKLNAKLDEVLETLRQERRHT